MKVAFGTIFVIVVSTVCTQKIQTTRTALHVARSLDPDSMETVSVKTKAGDVTNIIVKKRNGKAANITKEENDTEVHYELISTSNQNISEALIETNSTSNRTDRSDNVPEPVSISSSMIYVKHEPNKRGRSIVKVDHDGIPVVTGIRVPDDDTDKQVWRNARVINGILVPYDPLDKEIVVKSKPFKKPTIKPETVLTEEHNWAQIGSVVKKPTRLDPAPSTPPKDESWNDKKWDLYKKPVTLKPDMRSTSTVPLQTIEIVEEAGDPSGITYQQHPLGLWMPPETSTNPEHKYVTDKILEYIRNINKEEMKRLSMQKFTARDARMLPQAQPQIQSRILHAPSSSVFPTSAMYSLSTQAPSRVSFEEGVRTPVLQYAHPEYGVQSAKAAPTVSNENQLEYGEKKSMGYYPEDIHADRGPFVFEPAAPTEETEASTGDKRSYYQRPKKTLSYFYPEKTVNLPNDKYYGKYSPKHDYKMTDYPVLYYEDMDGRPFWLRLGDSLKEQVQTGIDKMSDLTRPVVQPLVEATQKISQNLGLGTGNRDLSTIREKLGTVSSSSLILPAIGIVAGGAALGLGAVAVGRYMNYDVVKMRNAKSLNFDNFTIATEATTENMENLWAEDKSRSVNIDTTTQKVRRKRSPRKNPEDNVDSKIQALDENFEAYNTENYPADVWSNTPCSKRVFCEAMLLQSEDAVQLMDKKIYTFLALINSDVASLVSPHLDDVMKSVQNRDCSSYICPSWKLQQSKGTDSS